MICLLVATAAAGLFAGAALYITAVEHPARVACGAEVAIREFAPSYACVAVLQATLAVVGCAGGLAAACRLGDAAVALASAMLGAVVPFTLVVVHPTNARLLDPALNGRDPEARALLAHWGRFTRSGARSRHCRSVCS